MALDNLTVFTGNANPRLAEDVAGFSDHWSFWQIGVAAAMVTDTAPLRYAHYHTPDDKVEHVDFDALGWGVPPSIVPATDTSPGTETWWPSGIVAPASWPVGV